ncbi:transmembrane protein, putative [Medicago truncatula]|uniref:Transmembrane protein, putative n=1 Tax=Medicago truncatula TaxID=3880 RepID=G7IHQ4_MEDTR|nr:transmembrane protein, putative [Medicago truncatula]
MAGLNLNAIMGQLGMKVYEMHLKLGIFKYGKAFIWGFMMIIHLLTSKAYEISERFMDDNEVIEEEVLKKMKL